MDKLKRMTLFTRVVELGTFVAAATDQGVSPALVGRYISELERTLSVRLINRTTRSMEVTEAGHRYYNGCKSALEQIVALEQDINQVKDSLSSGTIRIALPDALGNRLILDVVTRFQLQYPNIQFDLMIDNDLTDLVFSGVDLAIRLSIELEDSSMIGKRLGKTQQFLFASSHYIQNFGNPNTIEELKKSHTCVCFKTAHYGSHWIHGSPGNIKKFKMPWGLISNQTTLYQEAIINGIGIGPLPMIIAHPYVESGTLQKINFPMTFPDLHIDVLYVRRDFIPTRVKLFLEYLHSSFCITPIALLS